MKYLEVKRLTEISHELAGVVCGTRVVNGRIEAYSCKRAGTDKKYAHHLAERYQHEVSSQDVPFKDSPYANGPLGDFHESSTRRLLTDLILTLNASFPDYDFADVRPGNFRSVSSSKIAVNRVNERLSDLALKKVRLLNDLWNAIDEVINLHECKVYSFYADGEGCDPLVASSTSDSRSRSVSMGSNFDEESEPEVGATLWSFNYFFVNKHLKRIVFFTCVQSCLKEDAPSDDETQIITEQRYGENSFDDDEEEYCADIDDVAQPAVSVLHA